MNSIPKREYFQREDPFSKRKQNSSDGVALLHAPSTYENVSIPLSGEYIRMDRIYLKYLDVLTPCRTCPKNVNEFIYYLLMCVNGKQCRQWSYNVLRPVCLG